MKSKYLLVLMFSLAVQYATAQQNLLENELNSFVKTYMSSKVDKKRNSFEDKKIFDRYDVTQARYKQIAAYLLTNAPIELNSNENKLLAALKKQNILIKEFNLKNLKAKCLENEISYQKYLEILNQYQKDIQFQRSLKPHFDTYLKQLK